MKTALRLLSALVVAHTVYHFDKIVGRTPQRRSPAPGWGATPARAT